MFFHGAVRGLNFVTARLVFVDYSSVCVCVCAFALVCASASVCVVACVLSVLVACAGPWGQREFVWMAFLDCVARWASVQHFQQKA